MTTICKNCNNHFEGNYCNQCGQAAHIHKVTMHFIWHDLQHSLFHFDNGIFYTIGQLITRPGNSIREFIDGKRVRHFKPLSLVVVLATLYGLLYHFFIIKLYHVEPIQANDNLINAYEKIIKWTTDHFAYSTLILILITTIASYFVFKKRGRNFAEHLVLNTFYMGLFLVVSLLSLVVLYLFQGGSVLKWYAYINPLINFILMCWCYVQFFNNIPKIKSVGLTFLTVIINSAITLFIGYVIGWIISAA